MIIGILRTRLRPEAQAEYQAWAARISALARQAPGYISHKAYTAEDGERLTLVEFADQAGLAAWARDPDHVAAKKMGRERFFSELRVQVCAVERDSADRGGALGAGPRN